MLMLWMAALTKDVLAFKQLPSGEDRVRHNHFIHCSSLSVASDSMFESGC